MSASADIVLGVESQELWLRVEANVEWIEPRAGLIAAGEVERSQALDGKASQVLAVAAVATSIAATALAPRLAMSPAAARISALLAGVSVLAAAVTSVLALYPRSFSSFATTELEQWPTGDFLAQPSLDVHGHVLNGWLDMIVRARKVNVMKARLVRGALTCLGLALALITVAAAIIAT